MKIFGKEILTSIKRSAGDVLEGQSNNISKIILHDIEYGDTADKKDMILFKRPGLYQMPINRNRGTLVNVLLELTKPKVVDTGSTEEKVKYPVEMITNVYLHELIAIKNSLEDISSEEIKGVLVLINPMISKEEEAVLGEIVDALQSKGILTIVVNDREDESKINIMCEVSVDGMIKRVDSSYETQKEESDIEFEENYQVEEESKEIIIKGDVERDDKITDQPRPLVMIDELAQGLQTDTEQFEVPEVLAGEVQQEVQQEVQPEVQQEVQQEVQPEVQQEFVLRTPDRGDLLASNFTLDGTVYTDNVTGDRYQYVSHVDNIISVAKL